jgi:hypothetical protein
MLGRLVTEEGARRLALFLPEGLANFFQLFTPVFGFLPDLLADKDGRLGLGSQNDAVARSRVDLNDLRVDFVLGLEDDPGEIGVAAQIVNDDPFHLDVEGAKNVADKLMGQRTFVMLAPHGHGNGPTDTWLDMDDKALLLVADENGQRVLVRRENAKHLNAYHVRIHNLSVTLLGADDNLEVVRKIGTIPLGMRCSQGAFV